MPTVGEWPAKAIDLILLVYSLYVSNIWRVFASSTHQHGFGSILQSSVSVKSLLLTLTYLGLCHAAFHICAVYRLPDCKSLQHYAVCCIAALSFSIALVAPAQRFSSTSPVPWAAKALYFGLILALFLSARLIMLGFDHTMRSHFRVERKLLIVGTGSRAVDVYEELSLNPRYRYQLVGYVDSAPQAGFVPQQQILGPTEDLDAILMSMVIDEVVIALPMKSQYEKIGEIVKTCERLGIPSQYFTHHFGTVVTKKRRPTGSLDGRVVLETVHLDLRCYLKRSLDILGSLVALVFLSPLMLMTALAVKLSSHGPVFFSQERFGLNKRTFRMYKFRSMIVDAEGHQAKLEHLNETSGPAFKIAHDPRVTPVGRFIRKLSIDELPQLVNVLFGQMSLVGPRPLPLRDVSRFSESWLMRRFSVKPGLTCLWQVSGRSNTDFDRWIELDLEYIDRWSLSLDMHILLRTVPAVLKGRGAS